MRCMIISTSVHLPMHGGGKEEKRYKMDPPIALLETFSGVSTPNVAVMPAEKMLEPTI